MRLSRLFRRSRRKHKPTPLNMSGEDFVTWASAKEQGRHDLIWHEVVNVPAGRSGHTLAKAHVARCLGEALQSVGVAADIYTEGLVVPINMMHAYMPDIIVRLGPRLPPDATRCDDPDIIVEILPPGASRTDLQERTEFYFRVPSLRHFLILRMDDPVVLHHVRSKNDTVEGHKLMDGVVRLDPPGVTLGDLRLPPR
jgi:Uma2 family endonuclease